MVIVEAPTQIPSAFIGNPHEKRYCRKFGTGPFVLQSGFSDGNRYHENSGKRCDEGIMNKRAGECKGQRRQGSGYRVQGPGFRKEKEVRECLSV
jgi:hypothetical protein